MKMRSRAMSMNRLRLFNAIVVSMLCAGIVLVAFALATVKTLDRRVIEAAAARNRHAEFLLAASVVSRAVNRPEDLRDDKRMKPILADIQQLRPGIRALEIIEFVSGSAMAVIRTGSDSLDDHLTASDIHQLEAKNILSDFEGSGTDRLWVFTVPIESNGSVIGALRGRFSVMKYDQLIDAQEAVAKQVAVGAVIITSLTMLLLIHIQLHRPIARVLGTMEQVRSGNLALTAPISGPMEIRRLAEHFNLMMAQLRAVIVEKETLMTEIRAWNEQLESRVAQAVHELDEEKDKVAAAQMAAQRNSNLAALGEMSAIMAHELGNPLNAIYGRLQLIKKSKSPEEMTRHADVIATQVARMSEVIQHILKSTHIQSDIAAVDVNDVVNEATALLQGTNIKVMTHLARQLPPVAINRTALHGLLLNLINNAAQAMNNAGQLVVTTCMAHGPDSDGHALVKAVSTGEPMVRLLVEDDGVGIPSQILDKICEPFFTTRHEEGGTGLGLAICRRVVASAGGRLTVKSAPGKGTRFVVDFPVWTEQVST